MYYEFQVIPLGDAVTICMHLERPADPVPAGAHHLDAPPYVHLQEPHPSTIPLLHLRTWRAPYGPKQDVCTWSKKQTQYLQDAHHLNVPPEPPPELPPRPGARAWNRGQRAASSRSGRRSRLD